jgi:Tol biopolymer transport system component
MTLIDVMNVPQVGDPQISPDGHAVLYVQAAPNWKANKRISHIWKVNADGSGSLQITAGTDGENSPRWSPDGKQVAYRNTQGKTTGLYIRASDGSGKERQIGDRSDGVITVEDWSPDGKYLAITHVKLRGASNWHETLQVLRVAGEGKLEFEIDNVADGKFSPDGRWLTYHDDASGQVYVTAFPGPGARIAVSSSGGDEPRWRGDGQELFYVDDDQNLISVQVHESPTELHVLSSHRLFRIPLPNNAGFYDVTRDGKRFLVTIRTHKEQAAPLTVVTNWSAQFQDESKR